MTSYTSVMNQYSQRESLARACRNRKAMVHVPYKLCLHRAATPYGVLRSWNLKVDVKKYVSHHPSAFFYVSPLRVLHRSIDKRSWQIWPGAALPPIRSTNDRTTPPSLSTPFPTHNTARLDRRRKSSLISTPLLPYWIVDCH